MKIFGFLKRLFVPRPPLQLRELRERDLPVAELARRLDMSEEEVRHVEPSYQEFTIAKRGGGQRRILAPSPPLKQVQRRILRRLLGRLKSHPAARGFERGQSIVSNALPHVAQAVVLRMDLKDFFTATSASRVRAYFQSLGWNREASQLLVQLCTHQGGLPQGAPTSPRLSNLVNCRLDARLAGLAAGWPSRSKVRNPRTGEAVVKDQPPGATAAYTRYADDLTFSFSVADSGRVRSVIWFTKQIVRDEGYQLHVKKKLQIRRQHDRQLVTGLVVNKRINLPRECRRRLRAVEHHLRTGRPSTVTPAQLTGWKALATMVGQQAQR